jgi:hypothetical protein
MFAATNIQSAESQEETVLTKLLYAQIDGLNLAIKKLNLELVKKILANPAFNLETAERRLKEHPKAGNPTTPLLYICDLYTEYSTPEKIKTLNQITRELLKAGANPNLFIPYTPEERAKNFSTRTRAAHSPLTLAASRIGYSQYKSLKFLEVLISHDPTDVRSWPNTNSWPDINALDGDGKTALYCATEAFLQPSNKIFGPHTLSKQEQTLPAIEKLLVAGANPNQQNHIETNRGLIETTALELISSRVGIDESPLTLGQRVWHKLTPNIFQFSSQREIEQYNSNIRQANAMLSQVATGGPEGALVIRVEERIPLLLKIMVDFMLKNQLADKEDSEATLIARGVRVASIVSLVTAAHKIASKYGVYTRIANATKALAGRVAVAATT